MVSIIPTTMSRPSTGFKGSLRQWTGKLLHRKPPDPRVSGWGWGVPRAMGCSGEYEKWGWGWELSDHFKTQRQAMEMALGFLGTRKALEH